jgi:hypothetical protein
MFSPGDKFKHEDSDDNGRELEFATGFCVQYWKGKSEAAVHFRGAAEFFWDRFQKMIWLLW